jgi:hypothetical protein
MSSGDVIIIKSRSSSVLEAAACRAALMSSFRHGILQILDSVGVCFCSVSSWGKFLLVSNKLMDVSLVPTEPKLSSCKLQ